MPADEEVLNSAMELLTPLGGITSKPMFGGYGIFHDGAMFALISGTGLFFKTDASNISSYEKAGSKQYRPMPYYQVPDGILADAASLQDWAKASIAAAHAAATKKKK